MTSPGSRVITALTNSIRAGMSKIMSAVVPSCIRTGWAASRAVAPAAGVPAAGVPAGVATAAVAPAAGVRQERIRRACQSGTSSRVTRTGLIGQNVSEPLARSHCPSPRSPGARAARLPCQSRAVTSFTTT